MRAGHRAGVGALVRRAAPAGILLASVLTSVGPSGATPALGQLSPRPQVEALRFEGNQAFSDEALSRAILTRPTQCASLFYTPFCWAGADFAIDERSLNPRTLRDDHVRLYEFYGRRGYRNVQVDTTITPVGENAVSVLFRIQEGEPHRIVSLQYSGVEDVAGSPVTDDLPAQVGDPLDLELLDIARDTLTRRLRNRGYAHAEVLRNTFIPAGTREAEVEFDVYTGPRARFGPIDVTGNVEISEAVVMRMLPFGEGDVYQRELVLEAQRNLYGLDIFRYASITEDLTSEPDSIVPLEVQVGEGDTHRVRAGGGWNTEECFNTEARWTSRNYFGGARRLVLRGRVSNLLNSSFKEDLCADAGSEEYGELDWLVSADFTQPFIFSPRNSFAASVYAERQSLQNVFVRSAVGLNLGLTRRVSRSASVTPYYRPQLARLDAGEVFFCTSFLVCDPLDIDLLQSSNTLAPLGLSYSQDRSNQSINPTGGYIVLAEVETAQPWTGSDFEYHRAVAEISSYFGINEDFVVAARLRGGWLGAGTFQGLSAASTQADRRIAHPEKRFYAGGSNSVRGYAQNELGPQVVSIDVEDLVLPQDSVAAVCTPEAIAELTCDAGVLDDDEFFVRPTGGNRLVEGNLELRFPVWGEVIRGAAFVDFGHVWNRDRSLTFDDLVFTPGIGLRYSTPIGPVRIDVAYRGTPERSVPVVTSQLRPFDAGLDDAEDKVGFGTDAELDWVRAEDLARLGPRVVIGDESSSFWDGLQLHFSIGQAF